MTTQWAALENDDGGAAKDLTTGTKTSPTIDEMRQATQALKQGNLDQKLVAVQQFRKWLSLERCPPITEVLSCGVLPEFVQFLEISARPDIQFEAAWCLTNIASGDTEQTSIVIRAGVVPIFIQLMREGTLDVREQATWALGNIAGDCVEARDLVLQAGVLEPLMNIFAEKRVYLDEQQKPGLVRNGVWLLSNLCRSKPEPDYQLIGKTLGAIGMLLETNDIEVLTDACWTLSYWTDATESANKTKVNEVLESGIVVRLANLIMHESALVHTPALRAIGNIVTGEDYQTDMLLRTCPTLLTNLGTLVLQAKRNTKKEALWTISNITAGNTQQIQAVVDNGLFPTIIGVLSHTREFEIKREAAWAVCNAITGGNHSQIEYLVQAGAIPVLVELLDKDDTKLVNCALEATKCLLTMGVKKMRDSFSQTNVYAQSFEQLGGVAKLDNLQYACSNSRLYHQMVDLLNNHFNRDIDPRFGVDDGSTPDTLQFGSVVGEASAFKF